MHGSMGTLSCPAIPPEVQEFAAAQGVSPYLNAVIDLARQAFPSSALSVSLGQDDPNGVLEISDGVTRATRIAKLAPGATVPVVVIGRYRKSRASSPRLRDKV